LRGLGKAAILGQSSKVRRCQRESKAQRCQLAPA